MKIAEAVQSYWGGRAARYYDSICYLNKGKMRQALAGLLNMDVCGRVLDVGTGPGSVAEMLSDAGCRSVIGVDLNRDMLTVALDKLCGRDVRFIRADAFHLPLRTGSMDAVVSKWVLWVTPDPERAVAEMVRVTRPGGRVIAIESERSPKKKEPALRRLVFFPFRKAHRLYKYLVFRLPSSRTKEFWKNTEGRLPMHSLDRYVEIFRKQGLVEVGRTRIEEYGTPPGMLFFGGFRFSLICGTKKGDPLTSAPESQRDAGTAPGLRRDESDPQQCGGGLDGVVACPVCRTGLDKLNAAEGDSYECPDCRRRYTTEDGILELLPPHERLL